MPRTKRARSAEDVEEPYDLRREAQKLSSAELDRRYPKRSARTRLPSAGVDATQSESAPEDTDSNNPKSGSKKKRNPPYHMRREYGIPRVNVTKDEFLHVRPDGLHTTKVWTNPTTATKSLMLTNVEIYRLKLLRDFNGIKWSFPGKGDGWNSVTNEACRRFKISNDEKIDAGLAGQSPTLYSKPTSKRIPEASSKPFSRRQKLLSK
ncbi:uncharacterized protein RCO7_05101 [Rhynchosporium graminicola]|uniref:Uncharacterized protein n=1 Tax=Rhynchosporium graminicola TaxID=2792576 RepID=A0A1E1L6K7_9HELO|nr:uncharacterized protein RCO7_05101 [Rhynchosporium commune]